MAAPRSSRARLIAALAVAAVVMLEVTVAAVALAVAGPEGSPADTAAGSGTTSSGAGTEPATGLAGAVADPAGAAP
jgi:hypothetical protein